MVDWCNLITWFNSNEGFMMAILTFAIFIVTIGQFFLARYSNKLARETVTKTLRPYITVDLYPEDKLIHLRVKNTGSASAIDTSILFDKEVHIRNSTLKNEIPSLNKIPIILAGEGITFFLDERVLFMGKNKGVGILTGKVSYKGPFFPESYEESIRIDMGLYSEVINILAK